MSEPSPLPDALGSFRMFNSSRSVLKSRVDSLHCCVSWLAPWHMNSQCAQSWRYHGIPERNKIVYIWKWQHNAILSEIWVEILKCSKQMQFSANYCMQQSNVCDAFEQRRWTGGLTGSSRINRPGPTGSTEKWTSTWCSPQTFRRFDQHWLRPQLVKLIYGDATVWLTVKICCSNTIFLWMI